MESVETLEASPETINLCTSAGGVRLYMSVDGGESVDRRSEHPASLERIIRISECR